ncbi:MAG: 50S ribosomal protein L30, partial [Smithellaceae bacterium]
MGKMLKVKMVRSVIGRPEKQKKIVRGLGLKKLNSTVELLDTPEIRGMINKVS